MSGPWQVDRCHCSRPAGFWLGPWALGQASWVRLAVGARAKALPRPHSHSHTCESGGWLSWGPPLCSTLALRPGPEQLHNGDQNGLNGGPKKIGPTSESLEPVNVELFGRIISVDVIKNLRRGDHLGLSITMTSVLIKVTWWAI